MRRWAMLCVFALLLFASLFALAAWVKSYQLGNEVGLPLLAIAGVMALLGSVALVAVGFSMVNMADRTQALGLPNGSVRAVIALSLIVLFAILTVYLFSALNHSDHMTVVSCLKEDERGELVRSLQSAQLIGSVQNSRTESGEPCLLQPAMNALTPTTPATGASPGTPPAGTPPASPPAGMPPATPPTGTTPTGAAVPPAGGTSAGGTAPERLYTVYFRDSVDPASQDFAKQLLVLIGTLMTAVSAFYFGSKATADARDDAGPGDPPSLIAVTPAGVTRGGPGPVSLKMTGNKLNSVTQAQIAFGAMQISDANVVSNASQVLAHFTVPADAPIGPWDVIVTDSAGRQAKLVGALTVAPAAPIASDHGDPPSLAAVDPAIVTRGGADAVLVKISGSNLNNAKQAQIAFGDKRISDDAVVSNAGQVVAHFSLSVDAPTGPWDVIVTDSAGRQAKLAGALTVRDQAGGTSAPGGA